MKRVPSYFWPISEPGCSMLDTAIRAKIEASFAAQPAMTLLGAILSRVESGEVELTLPFDRKITQQHGFVMPACWAQ
jgi:acyl-coenzyme A thioesterase PaaI-like protein